MEKYRTSRGIILDRLKELVEIDTSSIAPADGGFYIYVDLGTENTTDQFGSVAMCKAVLEEEFVAFTPGIDFEDPGSGLGDRRFRISYAGGSSAVSEAMLRFKRFWPTWIDRVHHAQD